MSKLSVILNTLNEEKNIKRAIKSVKKIAEEIVVVDMHSDDDTRKIAKKLGAKVYLHDRTGYVEPARNYAISKAKNDWILILDADEEISKTLSKKIKKTIEETDKSYFTIPRKNMIFGKWIEHSGWWPDYNIRLFKKDNVEWADEIHSVPVTTGLGGDFDPKEENAIIHYHYDSVEQYIDRLNRYTTIQAKEHAKKHEEFDWTEIIKKPHSEFVSRFFMRKGYKDGFHGLALALLQSFSELVMILKVWQEFKFKRQHLTPEETISLLKESQKEINYWSADTLYQKNASLVNRLKRKFKLP